MKKAKHLLAASLLSLGLVGGLASCGQTGSQLEYSYHSAVSKVSIDSGYPGVVTVNTSLYTLDTYTNGDYILTLLGSMNLDGMTGEDGTNMYDYCNMYYGTFTVSASGDNFVYTLATPTRATSSSQAMTGYEAYMSVGYIDTDDETTYSDDYPTKEEQLEALNEDCASTVTVERTTFMILSVDSSN